MMFDDTSSLSRSTARTKPVARLSPLKRPHQAGQTDTRPAPQNPESWLARAETAETLEDFLLCLNRALSLNPYHRGAGRKMDESLQQILFHNAFLGYVDENEALYRVQTGANLMLHIPKDRAAPEPYPAKEVSPLRPAYRWLAVALLGLPLAGLGTLIGLPIALTYTVLAYRQPLSRADRVRAEMLITAAVILTGAAFILLLLLALHL